MLVGELHNVLWGAALGYIISSSRQPESDLKDLSYKFGDYIYNIFNSTDKKLLKSIGIDSIGVLIGKFLDHLGLEEEISEYVGEKITEEIRFEKLEKPNGVEQVVHNINDKE